MPTLENIATRLTGAKIFSKHDANHAHSTRWRKSVINYISHTIWMLQFLENTIWHQVAQETFQKWLSIDLSDIDDILLWGENIEEHDQCLQAALKTYTSQWTLSLFIWSHISWTQVTPQGIHPDSGKAKTITEISAPGDKNAV